MQGMGTLMSDCIRNTLLVPSHSISQAQMWAFLILLGILVRPCPNSDPQLGSQM